MVPKDADSDEEVFMDVDRIAEDNKAQHTIATKAFEERLSKQPQYDALKREPNFAHA